MDNNRGGEYTKIAHHLLYLSCTKGKIWVGVEREQSMQNMFTIFSMFVVYSSTQRPGGWTLGEGEDKNTIFCICPVQREDLGGVERERGSRQYKTV